MNLLEAIEIERDSSEGSDRGTQPSKLCKTVAVCDTQPVSAEGLRALLKANPGLEFCQAGESLSDATEIVRRYHPDVILLDKSFGIQAVLDWIASRRSEAEPLDAVVWGVSMTEAEALRFLQAGAKGIVRKTSNLLTVFACLRTVAEGSSWMADCVFHDGGRGRLNSRSTLTAREQQVLELVEQGLKNKEIARELGIRPGTVKIHLKHIFEKTGVRGRYGLALSAMREKGTLATVPAS